MQIHHKNISAIPQHQIRAVYNNATIRVYQAYSNLIADVALEKGTFVSPPFKMERMTWIKPSFLWMMYRSGWGFKDPSQSRILAIDIRREGFEWMLKNSCLSRSDVSMTKEAWEVKKNMSPVRIQWDPERNLFLQPMPYRTIQIGLSKEAVELYVNQWIKGITDVTPLARKIHTLIQNNMINEARIQLPIENPYDSSSIASNEIDTSNGISK